MEFHMDSCILMVTTYTKKNGLHFGKELPTEREFGNVVDHYTVAMKKVPVVMFPQDLKVILLEIFKYIDIA